MNEYEYTALDWKDEQRDDRTQWDNNPCPRCGLLSWFPAGHKVNPLDFCEGCNYELAAMDRNDE